MQRPLDFAQDKSRRALNPPQAEAWGLGVKSGHYSTKKEPGIGVPGSDS
jgi:hypothetical protein